MLALAVRFDLPDASAASAFDALVTAALPGIRTQEPGTLLYLTHTVQDAPLARVFYELYADRAAWAAHEARPQTAEFLERVGALEPSVHVDVLTPDEGALRVARG